jgi:hypothetical protein
MEGGLVRKQKKRVEAWNTRPENLEEIRIASRGQKTHLKSILSTEPLLARITAKGSIILLKRSSQGCSGGGGGHLLNCQVYPFVSLEVMISIEG